MAKYKFYINEKKKEVIAVCRWAGRPVKAKAKCAENDMFDLETGKKLAIAKCEYKVSILKYKHAVERYNKATRQIEEAKREIEAARNYFTNAVDNHDARVEELNSILKELGVTPFDQVGDC